MDEPGTDPGAAIARLRDAPDDRDRYDAVLALLDAPAPEALEPLCGALGDPNPDVRRMAAMALARLGDPRAIEPLLAVFAEDETRESGNLYLTSEKPASVASFALDALCRLGRPAAERLAERLSDPRERVRRGAVWGLGRIADPLASAALAPLAADADPAIRAMAIEAIGRIGAADGVPLLLAALSDPAWETRHAAATHLGRATEAFPHLRAEIAARLAASLGDGHATVAWAVRRALDEIERRSG